jgi:hypothetical protein
MRHLVERQYDQTSIVQMWQADVMLPFDVVAALSTSLAPFWDIERTIDPDGELSIIVAPAGDDLAQSGFILYEKDGFVEVATIFGDTWQGSRRFPTCQRAVAAIVAAADLICA